MTKGRIALLGAAMTSALVLAGGAGRHWRQGAGLLWPR